MVSPTPKRDDEGMNSPDRNDDGPLLICYDGSADAKHAIESAGALLAARPALVVTVWQPIASLDSVVWSGMIVGVDNFAELDRAAAEAGGRVADEGVRIAQQAGLEAEPLAIKAVGPVWKTIVETADRHQGHRTDLEDDRRDGRLSRRSGDCDRFSRADGRALDVAGKRLQRRRASRRPAHPGGPSQCRRRRLGLLRLGPLRATAIAAASLARRGPC